MPIHVFRQLTFPVRWMAPETLKDFIQWNAQAAVWSFAITVWEIAMLGADPYEGSLDSGLILAISSLFSTYVAAPHAP